jgi:two-component system, sensor histidine kinase PdtaS
MASLAELAREHTSITRDEVSHLNRLITEWGMLADFCFADLLLYLPSDSGDWITVGQMRPATSQTIYQTDWVGSWANDTERPMLAKAYQSGTIVEGDVQVEDLPDQTRMLAIPVRLGDRPIAVLTKEWLEQSGRRSGELEHIYSSIFDRFAVMIAAGAFPFSTRVGDSSAAPRVGDGVLLLDGDARVRYVSPNANSALHRVGIQTSALGMRLAELGFHDGPVRQAFERCVPVIEEFEQGSEVTLLCRCVPLLAHDDATGSDEVSGGVLLVRDVTELRKRDRLLLSKDATIREIHHRVKNNLQTISSLLRLQARRLTNAEAKAAVSESVRRIRTIALVHEALSREPGDDVTFIEIVRPLLRLAEEGLQSPDRPVRFTVRGDGGRVPAAVATPLSVVLTELLQNAVDHGFPEGSGGGEVVVRLDNDETRMAIKVVDNGHGVEPDFELEAATGLGLSIVRTLVTTELNGSIEMRPVGRDELVEAGIGVDGSPHGTVVDLVVPIDSF